jgi:hypothetical protein
MEKRRLVGLVGILVLSLILAKTYQSASFLREWIGLGLLLSNLAIFEIAYFTSVDVTLRFVGVIGAISLVLLLSSITNLPYPPSGDAAWTSALVGAFYGVFLFLFIEGEKKK